MDDAQGGGWPTVWPQPCPAGVDCTKGQPRRRARRTLCPLGNPATLQAMRDVLGSTHHESGTLWMGTDPAMSVTDGFGVFREVPNAYVAGPTLFPQMGSSNSMLTGIALARRTAERINVL